MDEGVFNHAKDRGWWDGPDRFYCVNRNVIGNCQARTVQEMMSALYRGKIGFDMGGPGFRSSDGRYCRGFDLHNAESIKGDILNLPLKDNCLDYIVTFHTLEHVEDIRRAISEFIRVLKHNAIIYAVIPDRRYFSHGYDSTFVRGVNAPSEVVPDEMLVIIKEYKELEILLFDTHLNNLDFNMFLRVNKLKGEEIMTNDVNVQTDFLEFFGKPYEDVIEPIEKYVRMGCNEDYIKREAFYKYQPKNREELAKLYDSDEMLSMYARNIGNNWFAALSQISEQEKRTSYIYKMAYDLFSDKRDVSILDHGCGSAIYAFKLLFQGFNNITIADIPHRHFKFLQFLCDKYQVKMKFLPLEGDASLIEKYDYIVSSEVLEHVWEPEEVLVHMIEHMKDDGWMYLSTFFDDMRGQDPTHLVQNTKRYNNPDIWLAKVREHGLEPVIFDMNSVPKGFQKR